MSLNWNVYSPLSANTWTRRGVDMAPSTDSKTLLSTLRLPVLFRGTRAQLLAAFRFGKQNAPHGGDGMFCLGMENPQLVQFTDLTPHWTGDVTWVGIHSENSVGSSTRALVSTPKYSAREANFPLEVPVDGGDPITIGVAPPFAPIGTNAGGKFWRSRRLDQVPVRLMRGVIVSSVEPSAVHPDVLAAKALFPKPPAGIVANYGWVPDPVFVTWSGGNAAPNGNPGPNSNPADWFCRDFDIVDRYAPINGSPLSKAVYVISATWSYEQLRQIS